MPLQSRKRTGRMTSPPKMKLRELPRPNEKDREMAQTEQEMDLVLSKEIQVEKTLRRICSKLRRLQNQRQTLFR
jgi:hypothetical protein